MSSAIVGAAVGAAFGLGAVIAVAGYRTVRTPPIEIRVLPYVRDLAAISALPVKNAELTSAIVEKVHTVQQAVAETVSGTAGVERRLSRSGSTDSVADFRAKQWSSGVVGFAIASGLGIVLWGSTQFSVIGILGLSLAGFVGGMFWCDLRLSVAVNRYEAQMAREFPIVADLLALSVAAGESPLAAVQRVVLVSQGALSKELAKLVAQVRSGGTTADAFESLSQRVGVASVSRFAATMAVAIERGTPLISVLHAQAEDAREASRRTLIESAGRREILMLMPVVFLVLPTVIVFAFFPGMIALTFVSG